MRKFLYFFYLVFLGISGCQFNYNSDHKKADDSANIEELELSKKAFKYVENYQIDSLKDMFTNEVKNTLEPENLKNTIKEWQQIIKQSEYPEDSSIIFSQSTNYSLKGKKLIKEFCFPFQNKDFSDSIKYFNITFIDKEIYKFTISDHPPGIWFVEPDHKEPHIDSLNLHTDNINWFRIWYNGGKDDNKKYRHTTGYYAVSGDEKDLGKIGIKAQLQNLFDLLNQAKYDSLDFKYIDDGKIGDPEWIYLRFTFDNEEYKDLGEFTISYFIKEEEGKKEILSDYIILKHTEMTRYLLRKDRNQEIVNILSDIGHHDYGKNYERFP